MKIDYFDVNSRFYRVKFASLSATSTTFFSRTFDKQKFAFVVPKVKDELGRDVDSKPPIFQKHSGGLSVKAARNLRKSINALLVGVDENILLDGKGKDKISFITLTLASSQVKKIHFSSIDWFATDKQIKKSCLNQFLTELKETQGVKNFVWVAEKQLNGSIHFHILVDRFVPYQWVRSKWNTIQNKFGFVDRYASKMKKMSESDYIELRKSESRAFSDSVLLKYKKAYQEGVLSSWMNPNSTDVHRLSSVKNVASYICKYMSKGVVESDSERIKYATSLCSEYNCSPVVIDELYTISGRIWQCSQTVSKARRCVVCCEGDYEDDVKKLCLSDVVVFDDNERFITILHTFQQLKDCCKRIFEDFVRYIRFRFSPTPLFPLEGAFYYSL